jgi:hypothetical protein
MQIIKLLEYLGIALWIGSLVYLVVAYKDD